MTYDFAAARIRDKKAEAKRAAKEHAARMIKVVDLAEELNQLLRPAGPQMYSEEGVSEYMAYLDAMRGYLDETIREFKTEYGIA